MSVVYDKEDLELGEQVLLGLLKGDNALGVGLEHSSVRGAGALYPRATEKSQDL